MVYPVITIPAGAAQQTEPLGTKFKFWYQDESYGLSLFKEGRPGTGENWAEKIASELAKTIEMPHAFYELAVYENHQGVVSRSLVNRDARVIHGNELLPTYVAINPTTGFKQHRNQGHTLRRVLAYLIGGNERLGAPYGWRQTQRIYTALDFFIGYLMFDTWIANQDRHDENWGVLRLNDGNVFLAPSYDHGSSMGRNELDVNRELRLNTKDKPRHITSYVATARSSFYPHVAAGKNNPMYTLDAFVQAAGQSPNAANEWRERLAEVDGNTVTTIINSIPNDWMSEIAKTFTAELLVLNKARILKATI